VSRDPWWEWLPACGQKVEQRRSRVRPHIDV
jgi:hypothetical protein